LKTNNDGSYKFVIDEVDMSLLRPHCTSSRAQ